MSKLNKINFTEYLNDSDSDSDSKSESGLIDIYSNNNEIINVDNISYDECDKCQEKSLKIDYKSLYNSSDDSYKKCIKDLSNNKIESSSSDNCCKTELSSCDNYNKSFQDNSETINTEDYNFDHNCMSFSSQIGRKKVCVKEKNNQIEIRQIYLEKKIKQLEVIGNTFKKIGHSIEYYRYNLENSKDLILRENDDDEASILLNDTSLNLHNIILLEIKKNLNPSRLRYVSIENVKLYEIPKIDLHFNNGILHFSIIDNKKIYNFNIGCKYNNSDDLEDSIDDALEESKQVYNYFNSRFNKISTIINYIKILWNIGIHIIQIKFIRYNMKI